MMHWILTTGLAAGLLAAGSATASVRDAEPRNPVRTDRSIVLKAVVDAPLADVWELWTTENGVRSFFGEDALIEAREGGRYEIYFLSRDAPDSDANSSKGARILRLDPKSTLAFEWAAPPFAAELNTVPLPLWVEVRLSALDTELPRTVVVLENHGYGRSEQWDRVYEFFVRGWSEILYRLQRKAADPDFAAHW